RGLDVRGAAVHRRGRGPVTRRTPARERAGAGADAAAPGTVGRTAPGAAVFGRRRAAEGGCSAGAELLHDDLAHAAGVGLTAGGLPDRADQRADRLDLAALDLGDHVRVVGDRLVHRAGEHGVVGDHGEALGLDDRGRVALAV